MSSYLLNSRSRQGPCSLGDCEDLLDSEIGVCLVQHNAYVGRGIDNGSPSTTRGDSRSEMSSPFNCVNIPPTHHRYAVRVNALYSGGYYLHANGGTNHGHDNEFIITIDVQAWVLESGCNHSPLTRLCILQTSAIILKNPN